MSKFGYIKLQDNLMLIAAENDINTSEYLMEQVKFANLDKRKVLFIDYETIEDILENKQYRYLNNDGIINVFDNNYSIDALEKTIIETKPEYVYINTLSLMAVFNKKDSEIKYIIDLLNELANKYSVKILVTDKYTTNYEKYLTSTYGVINSIWILYKDTMNRIK